MRPIGSVALDFMVAHPWILPSLIGFFMGGALGLGPTARALVPKLLDAFIGIFKDNKTGGYSVKRVVLFMGGASLSWAVLVLSHSAASGNQTVTGTMWAVTVPLAAMGGAGYIGGKWVEGKLQGVPGLPDLSAPPPPAHAAPAPPAPSPAPPHPHSDKP